jgi:hypothetical protein
VTRVESEAGAILLRDVALESVLLDVTRGRIELRCEGTTLVFEGVRATTLLGPWDGARGRVEEARVVAVEPGSTCVEVRVRYETVPRVYRIVAAQCSVDAQPRR